MRHAELDLDSLYVRNSVYEYTSGFNFRALWALGAGILIALLGLIVPPLYVLYKYAWFVGFLMSGIVYYVLMTWTGEKVWPSQKQESSAQII